MLVARLPGKPPSEQVSVQPGYTYKKGSTVELKVGGPNSSCSPTASMPGRARATEDKALIAAMKGGTTMTVKGTSTRDTYSLDTYSLNGFTAAYDAMRDACPSEPTRLRRSGRAMAARA